MAACRKFSKCESSLYLWFLQVLIVLGLTSLAIWACLIPKTPIFTISAIDLKPHQNNSALPKSSSIAMNVTISNPNKRVGIFFDDLHITLRCKNDSVGSKKSVPGFYLGHKNSDSEEVELAVNALENELCEKVDLRVGMETRVRYKIMRFETKLRRLVFEDEVQIGPDGRMLGTRDMKLLKL